MHKLPGAVVVVDSDNEKIAVQEARKLKIPVVALLDTNCDPDEVDFPIPGNDDAIRSIKCVCSALADAIMKGSKEYNSGKTEVKQVKKETQKKTPKEDVKEEAVKVEEKPVKKAAKKEVAEKPAATKKEEEVKETPAKEDIEGDISLG